ncbi:MAG: hypothetical protein JW821_17945 [Deltaproteobacteria bacterium]|nr:hypothetical protein [Deltaproteobacteria bacterium]
MPNGSSLEFARPKTLPMNPNKSYANVRCRELHFDAYKHMIEKVHARRARKWTMKGGKFLLNVAKDFALGCASGGIGKGFEKVPGNFGTMFENKGTELGQKILFEIGKSEVMTPIDMITGEIVDGTQEKTGKLAEKRFKISEFAKRCYHWAKGKTGVKWDKAASDFMYETPDLKCKYIDVGALKNYFDEKLKAGEDLPKVVAYNLSETLVAYGDYVQAQKDNMFKGLAGKRTCTAAMEVATAMYYFVRRYYKLCFHLNHLREEYCYLDYAMAFTKDTWDAVADDMNNKIKAMVASPDHSACAQYGCCYAAKSITEPNKPLMPRTARVSFTSKEEQEKYFWSHNVSGTRQNF